MENDTDSNNKATPLMQKKKGSLVRRSPSGALAVLSI
jgi:hypothetical protein